jgi:hypothetical protein
MDGLGMSIVVQTRFFIDGQGGGEWLPWEDHEIDESSGLNGDDVPGHGLAVMYEVRIKPAFEPGWYRSLVNEEVCQFYKSPHVPGRPNIWKRVRFVDDDE